jgi:hypothetical protein
MHCTLMQVSTPCTFCAVRGGHAPAAAALDHHGNLDGEQYATAGAVQCEELIAEALGRQWTPSKADRPRCGAEVAARLIRRVNSLFAP